MLDRDRFVIVYYFEPVAIFIHGPWILSQPFVRMKAVIRVPAKLPTSLLLHF